MQKKISRLISIALLAFWSMSGAAFNVNYDIAISEGASNNINIQVPPNYGNSYSRQYNTVFDNWGAWDYNYTNAGGTIDYSSYIAGPGNYADIEFLIGYDADMNLPVNPDPTSYSLGVANISARFTIDVPVLYEVTLDCTGNLSYAEFTLRNQTTNRTVSTETITSCSGPITLTGRLGPGAISFFSFSNGRAGNTYAESSLKLTAVPVPAAVWLFASALGIVGWINRKLRTEASLS